MNFGCRGFAFFCVCGFTLLLPASAPGDAAPPGDGSPESNACKDKSFGDECTIYGAKGSCREDWCETYGKTPCLKCHPLGNDERSSGCDCASLGRSTVKELGAFVLAGSFSLLFFLRRRKPRR